MKQINPYKNIWQPIKVNYTKKKAANLGGY